MLLTFDLIRQEAFRVGLTRGQLLYYITRAYMQQGSTLIVLFYLQEHYYQPMWTLVGGGIKKVEDSAKKMSKILPKKSTWMQTKAVAFNPDKNTVTVKTGEEVFYVQSLISSNQRL